MRTFSLRPWFAHGVPAPRHGPAARFSTPALRVEGMQFTDWMLVGVLGLACFISISQPLFGLQLHHSILNHFPLMLMLAVLTLHLVGMGMNRQLVPWQTLLSVWPLAALGLFALVGSLVAKYALQEKDSYLSFAIYMLLIPLYIGCIARDSQRLRSWALALITVWLLTSLAALSGEVLRIGARESLHEIEYLVITGFFAMFYVSRGWAFKLLALTLLLASAVLNHKLTGYIIATMAVLHIVGAAGWRRLPREWKLPYAAAAIVGTLVVAGALTFLYFEFRYYLPSGNAGVRLSQYEAVWSQFLRSPVWGYAYLAGSGEDYREYTRLLNIPTHSDVLDMLKHGGLIALLLFVWGYVKIFLIVNRAVVESQHDRVLNAYFLGARFFQVTALVTFAINPLLLKGPFLIVIWANLGLAVGLALCLRRQTAAAGP